MTRTSRFHLILCTVALCALVAAPLASARPLDRTSQVVQRTDDGWFDTALRWVEDLVGVHPSPLGRAASSPSSSQKDFNTPAGGACIDPTGRPGCSG